MVAWANAEAVRDKQLTEGRAVYWSRSRGKLWRKGEESGNVQRLVEMRLDCDCRRAVLSRRAARRTIACHTGRRSCFYRRLDEATNGAAVEPVIKRPRPDVLPSSEKPSMSDVLDQLAAKRSRNASRRAPRAPMSSSLHHKGLNKILEKVGEEATEAILAAKDLGAAPDSDALRQALVGETADLWFHMRWSC